MRLVALAVASVGLVGLVGLDPLARAEARPDPRSDSKIARADQLFDEGKALLESNLLLACAKFDESLRYNPAAIGTLLNVALCDEKLGRVASAVDKFSEARDRALEQGLPEHVRAAQQHIAALEARVPHLAIKLTEHLPSTTILIDDHIVALATIANVPVDPGERVITVTAPSRLPYQTRVVVGIAGHADVVIPALTTSVTVTSSLRRIGQISTAVGGAAAGAGLGLGLYARYLYRRQFADGRCMHTTTGDHCSAAGQSKTESAHTYGNVGTVVGVVGVVVAGAGAYLWYRSPSSTARAPADARLTVVPQLAPGTLGVVATGRF